MNTPSPDTQKMLDVMRKAVEKALDRKNASVNTPSFGKMANQC